MFLKTVLATGFVLAGLGGAIAQDDASNFLANMEGEFRGKGTTHVALTKSQERVNCKLKNSFNAESGELQINGRCATAQGHAKVKGALTAANGSIAGSFLSPQIGKSVTRSNGKFENGELVLQLEMTDNMTGKKSQYVQIIRGVGGAAFETTLGKYDPSRGGYVQQGHITFAKREG